MHLKELTRNQTIEEVYESGFLKVARFIAKMRGSEEEAIDIFHDSLIIYMDKIRQKDFVLNSTPEAYLLGIAKHLWSKRVTDSRKSVSLEDYHYPDITEESNIEVSKMTLLYFLKKTGKKCLDLLRAFYFEENSIQKIAGLFGFKSNHSAAVQKYKCVEKLRETIKTKSITYEDFFE